MNFSVIENNLYNVILSGHSEFIIYPFGESGFLTKQILNQQYGIQEKYIIDKKFSFFNRQIKNVDFLDTINCKNYVFLVASTNYHNEIESILLSKQIPKNNIINVLHKDNSNKQLNYVGIKSYGPLAYEYNPLIESIGAFCSFASGTCAVPNHILNAVTNHGFLFSFGKDNSKRNPDLVLVDNQKYNLFEEKVNKKVKIGNDVWLGQNVIITSGVTIGNGVIAGAGAVITRNVPDYAVVVGVPAKIVKYRFTRDQIKKLNEIKWWDWDLDKIRDCYNDFFDIDFFINKHFKEC